MIHDAPNPFQQLVVLEESFRHHAQPLPRRVAAEEPWLGIGFRIAGLDLLVPLPEVVEILTPPALSRVPGARGWVRGLANVRGNLLPVMDLHGYLYGQVSHISARSRILVVDHEGIYSGLLVAEVLGLKHFAPRQHLERPPADDQALQPYLVAGFDDGERQWSVFSLHRLAVTPRFLQVAV